MLVGKVGEMFSNCIKFRVVAALFLQANII